MKRKEFFPFIIPLSLYAAFRTDECLLQEVEGEFQGPFIGDLIRHSYLNHIHPCACFYYNSRERTLAVNGPRVEVTQIQK